MSTERRTDRGDHVFVETGEPTVENPTVWSSTSVEWKPGTTGANAATMTAQAEAAVDSLRTVANGTGTMTGAQLTVAVRGMARVLIAILRLQLRRLDSAD